MRTKYILAGLAGIVVLTLITGAFSAGFLMGHNLDPMARALQGQFDPGSLFGLSDPAQSSPLAGAPQFSDQAGTPDELQEMFTPFWEAWSVVHDRYVDQPLDDELLVRGAIDGMLQALDDPHTSYLDPEQFRQSNMQLDGEYQGIGAWVDTQSEYLTIISPMPGSPAEQAGLKPGDEVLAVDGEDMTGVDASLVIRQVMGPEGTTVVLTIRREGVSEPLEIKVVRSRIAIPSVESEILDGGIAYVQLVQFGDDSADDLRAALETLLDQDPTGLILDLRANGGGFLTSAIEITSEFIPEGVLLYEEYGDGSRDTHRALNGGIATEIPLVVLINGGSASASEILAGAVQDYGRGLLVGTPSFGKGSVQIVQKLSGEEGAVRVTIARWLTPNERQINGEGLTPDVEVAISEEDIAADRDPQLETAVQLLDSGT
jgi:carboxyl-terminal processing protease